MRKLSGSYGSASQLPGGDLDRAENQRNVIKAIVQKGLSVQVISDPATFINFIGNVAKHLTVDNDLSDERDQAYRSVATADRQGHRTAPGPDLRFWNLTGRAEH